VKARGSNLKRRPPIKRAKLVPPPTRTQVANQELLSGTDHIIRARWEIERACAHLSGLVMPTDGAALLEKLREMQRMLKDARYACINLTRKCESDRDFTEKRGKHDACLGLPS